MLNACQSMRDMISTGGFKVWCGCGVDQIQRLGSDLVRLTSSDQLVKLSRYERLNDILGLRSKDPLFPWWSWAWLHCL